MAEKTGGKDDPTAEPAAKSADGARAGASTRTRSTRKKSTASAGKTSGTSRARASKASDATAGRSKARRPTTAKKKSAAASAAKEKSTDARATSDRGTKAGGGTTSEPQAGGSTASEPQASGIETVARGRGRDEFWRALGIIGFGTISVGLVGLAALGGLVQSVMRVSRPRETPPLTGFQKGVAAYLRQIVDYLAAPEVSARLPFPFSDFPDDASSADDAHDGESGK